MRAHVIENGVVTNTIEVESLDFLPNLIDGIKGGIGWLWDGENITPPTPAAAAVPLSVSMRQARLALLAAGLLGGVEAAVSAAGQSAQIEWEFATDVRRDHPLIAVVQAQQGMTDAQIDELFRKAATL